MSEIKKLGDVQLDNRNANKGKPRGQKQIVGSIQRNGFGRSGLLDRNGRAIAGNKTTEAAVEVFGVEAEPIIVQTDGKRPVYVQRTDLDLDDPNPNNPARRLAYEDNLSSYFSFELDPEIVSADMSLGFDFEAIDVSLSDLSVMLEGAADSLLGGDGAPPSDDPALLMDRAEELQKKWKVNPGDIWQMGQHFVICGDCREADTWARLLKAAAVEKVNGVFTSPPYAEQRKQQYGGVPTAEYVDWWEAVQGNVRANLAQDGSFFVNIKPHCEDGQRVLYVFDLVLAMVRRWDWRLVEELCWRNSGTPKKVDRRFKNQFEPVYQFCTNSDFRFIPEAVLKPTDREFKGDGRTLSKHQGVGESISAIVQPHDGLAYPGNVIDVNFETSTGHSGAFPVALPTFFIKAFSDPGDVWLDPFCGSGTSIIAAHNEKRRGLGIERLEKYVSVILQRFVDTTGKDPVLLSK